MWIENLCLNSTSTINCTPIGPARAICNASTTFRAQGTAKLTDQLHAIDSASSESQGNGIPRNNSIRSEAAVGFTCHIRRFVRRDENQSGIVNAARSAHTPRDPLDARHIGIRMRLPAIWPITVVSTYIRYPSRHVYHRRTWGAGGWREVDIDLTKKNATTATPFTSHGSSHCRPSQAYQESVELAKRKSIGD